MVKEKKEGGMELHLFPSKEAMARWRGEDSEHDVEGRYQEWVLPVEVLEDLWGRWIWRNGGRSIICKIGRASCRERV